MSVLALPHLGTFASISFNWVRLYPQIRLLYGIQSKAAISLPFNLHRKAIAALFFVPYCHPI